MNNSEQCVNLESWSAAVRAIEPPKVPPRRIFSVGHWWHRLVETIAHANALQVWRRCDRGGHCYWKAYDPTTGRSTTAGSGAEIRAWIEEGRYQK